MLLPYFEWLENTAIGTAVRNSIWAFPVIEAAHLLALCVLGGALLMVDLRLLGTGLNRQDAGQLLRHVRPWLTGSIVVLIATGVLLFLSEAVKCYYNTSFWVKMVALPIGIAFTYLVRDRLVLTGGDRGFQLRAVGAMSLALWFVIAAAGRWIGFS